MKLYISNIIYFLLHNTRTYANCIFLLQTFFLLLVTASTSKLRYTMKRKSKCEKSSPFHFVQETRLHCPGVVVQYRFFLCPCIHMYTHIYTGTLKSQNTTVSLLFNCNVEQNFLFERVYGIECRR